MCLPRVVPRLLTVAAGLLAAVALLPAPPVAAATAPADEAEVRLVVRTAAGAGAEVAAALRARGVVPHRRLGPLRAVTADVPQSWVGSLSRALLRRSDVTSVTSAHRRTFFEEPADPRFAEQRPYFDAVRATAAWARSAHGRPDVRIGVVDSGADVTHPDLTGKVAGTYNAVTGGTDVRDQVGHGTGVASVAAAATNNGVGISGAGYDSTLLVAKVADRAGRIFTDDLARGIVWAVDSGADVINLSLGGPSSDRLERDAIAYAQRRDVLVVAAAGNDGTSIRQFPAALPGVLSVGATTVNGSARAAFSSYGSWVDVGAPGRDLLVAAPGGGYELADGTSFAAPLVAGQVALLEGFRPGRTATSLAAAVIAGANTAKLGFARGLVDFDASLDLLPPGSTPTLMLPADPVSGFVTVSASSSAPAVRLTLADQSETATTVNGVASTSFETYGLGGAQPVTATDCSVIGQCAATGAAATLTVANPAPTLTAPADGSDASADTVTARADAPGGAVRFLVDGTAVAVDTTMPFEADLPTEGLADGSHTVSAMQCRADGTRCDTSTVSRVAVSVARLHPRLTDVSTRVLSPGRDGRKDTLQLTYRLGTRQSVSLRVRDAAGRVVLQRRLGVQGAGRHSTVWDGRSAAGVFVPGGVYRVGVATRQPGGSLIGLASAAVRVDRRAPRLDQIAREFATVFPRRDDYRDTVRVSARTGEAVDWVQVEARSPSGAVYRSAKRPGGQPGPVAVVWNARVSGAPVPAGTYSVRLLAQDQAGNRSRSRAVRLTVSDRQLQRRIGTRTVTARRSLQETFADECSLVFRHTEGPRRGWIGYYSSGTCSSGDAYAIGEHQLRLPAAVRFGTVQISAYGGRGDPKYRDSARVTYYDRFQNPSGHKFRLGPRTDTYTGPRVKADGIVGPQRMLRWSTQTTGVQWYDVERYTVRFSYFVLR